MKKDILFIVSDMESGGFQKSLISLLKEFNYKKYNVDLLILSPKGIFMNDIPSEVNIINSNILIDFFDTFPKNIIKMLKKREIILAFKRLIQFILARIDRGIGGIYMSKCIPKINNKYDVAIDYNGQHVLYYMVDKINADKKISYFHSDYKKWSYYKLADKKYYPKVDYIVTISEICKQSLDEIFPECKEKTRVIENISSPKIIRELALKECKVKFDNNYINIIMVGRPSKTKGYDFAIEACKKLKDEGYKVKFYSIGISDEMSTFKSMVKKYNLENDFIFLGETNNPYNYIRQADIYVHPSRFEGKSVAIDEAKILCKPIVISNFTTAKDHIKNEVNGLIVNMNCEGVYEGIKRLIDNKELSKKFIYSLKNDNFGNEREVEKLYELIE